MIIRQKNIDWSPILGFIICAVAFYPGIMTSDSFSQLEQARNLVFHDWHPPMMAWIWSILNVVYPSGGGFLFLDLFLLWYGLFVFKHNIKSRYAGYLYLIGFFPFIIGLSGIIWKDVATAYMLLWATIYLLKEKQSVNILIFFAFLFLAVGLRYNSIFSALPLVFLYLWEWLSHLQHIKLKAVKAGILSLIFVGFIFGLSNYFNYHIINAKKDHPSIVILIDDIAYISYVTKTEFLPGISVDEIKTSIETSPNDNVFRLTPSQGHFDYLEIKSIWKAAVTEHPSLYLSYRTHVFLRFLGFSLKPPFMLNVPSYSYWEDHSYQDPTSNGLRLLIGWYVTTAASLFPFLFAGYFWLGLGIVTLFLGIRNRENLLGRISIALSISSSLNIFSYILVANSPYFRYFYWSVLAITLSAFLLAFVVLEKRKVRVTESQSR